MRKLLLALILILSLQGISQTPAVGLVGLSLTGNGVIFEAGMKLKDVKMAVAYNGSGTHEHEHFLGMVGYSIKLAEYDDDYWVHSLLLTPSIGYSLGTRKQEVSKDNTAGTTVVKARENNILLQIEASYKVDGLEMFINATRTSKNYIGIGFRGYF